MARFVLFYIDPFLFRRASYRMTRTSPLSLWDRHLFQEKIGNSFLLSKFFVFLQREERLVMDKTIIENIKKTLDASLPKQAMALLYGSQARGDARKESDWDILIVLDKDKLTPEDYDTITYPLTKLGWDLGAEINPIMYTKKEWEASRITPFYHNVTEDAIAL